METLDAAPPSPDIGLLCPVLNDHKKITKKKKKAKKMKKEKQKALDRIYAIPPCFGFAEAWRHYGKKWVYKDDKRAALVYLPANNKFMLEWENLTISVFEPRMDALYTALTESCFTDKCPHFKLPGGLKLSNTKTQKAI